MDDKLDRDIEENRKGQFVINFKNANGDPIDDVKVEVRQVSHEFKFGCSLFYLEQFHINEMLTIYKNNG